MQVWGIPAWSPASLVWYCGFLPLAYAFTTVVVCPGTFRSFRKPAAVVVCGLAVYPIGPLFHLNGSCGDGTGGGGVGADGWRQRFGEAMVWQIGCWALPAVSVCVCGDGGGAGGGGMRTPTRAWARVRSWWA
jgi:hypothetical protein